MSLPDRILPITDLLLGMAHADQELRDQERAAVRATLARLAGEVSADVEARIAAFDPATFQLATVAAAFAGDPAEERLHLLQLVAAVSEADAEYDLAEDDYVRALGEALGLPQEAIAGLTLEVEVEELKAKLGRVRRSPPPPPAKK